MNTYGGTVIHADSIRTRILNTKTPVFVFIDNNAASAGALISIACDSIYMRPGANIGATTVVNQEGAAMPDKYQSYMRSTMRSTAEATNRNPDIAEAMVDERIKIAGVSDSGKVLTFTTKEAIANNYCEGQAESIEEVLQLAGITDYKIIEYKPTQLEKIINTLVNPVLSGILIMIIIGGIYFELQTPGIGFPLAAAIIAAILYFAPLYLEGLANNWEILLFIAGLILIGLEVFVIPGFGVAGILGIILTITGLALSMVDNIGFDFTFTHSGTLIRAFIIVLTSLILSISAAVLLGAKLVTSSAFNRLILQKTQDSSDGYIGVDNREQELIGKNGKALTILRPAGKVTIDGDIYDAVAETGYIEEGEEVTVIKFETTQLFVRKTQ
jgi:membrane-bound serine protease (ClpP class)